MPIRPENKHRYPPDWPDISLGVKTAAGWRCECDGRCGWAKCGTSLGGGRCLASHGMPHPTTGSGVILTTAHLNHLPEDCRRENLMALCQGCHLAYDQDHHRESARAAKESSQPPLLGPYTAP
mgnify:CR=1 FL=1